MVKFMNIIKLNENFISEIDNLLKENNINILKNRIKEIKYKLTNSEEFFKNGVYEVSREWLIKNITHAEKSKSVERVKHYLKKIIKGLTEIKTTGINEINLNRWEEYTEIITDSLWIIDRRDNSGVHKAWYHGNFIPQIPRQMMLRYTKKYDLVVDTFLGSGTTLIECRRLGRHGIGIELNKEVAEKAKELINKEANPYNVITEVVVGDSREIDFEEILKKFGFKSCQLLIMHPPYHDIIKFSDDERDLSNAKTVKDFLKMFEEVVDNTYNILDDGRFLVLVIGDKYSNGAWIPLGFYCMDAVLKRGYKLKSIVVKNFEETKGKRNQKELWRYRALVGGFYVFKHEYIFIFQKVEK
ncbi:Methyltransferase [Methanocaldococcus lauensis]|uniref:Type II methyltransferase n=2 Tax=Methanocaldococcus lauensis TaxID=2546128 RepID=A0A8D6PZ52_9EURY|nr:Methyltransferase [Methanocaldococcus lauensis]